VNVDGAERMRAASGKIEVVQEEEQLMGEENSLFKGEGEKGLFSYGEESLVGEWSVT
jgi:hypothetical protein